MLLMGALQDGGENRIGWVWYLLVVLGSLVLIIWWMYQQSKKQSKKQIKQEVTKDPEKARRERVKDDLTRIEGIKSFDSLSNADPAEVKTVLNQAGLQMMNPKGWIEQAEFAAKEDWDGLQKLQDELKGGRRR